MAFVFVLLTVAYATYAERKIIGHMQVRLGPMRTGWPNGFVAADRRRSQALLQGGDHSLAEASTFAFLLAPLIALIPAFITFAVIPFGGVIEDLRAIMIPLQIASYC